MRRRRSVLIASTRAVTSTTPALLTRALMRPSWRPPAWNIARMSAFARHVALHRDGGAAVCTDGIDHACAAASLAR